MTREELINPSDVTIVSLSEQHLIVQVSDLYTHVLDVGIGHEPCCHFVIFGSPRMQNTANIVPVPGVTSETIDLKTLDLFKVTITKTQLLRAYLDENSSVDNKLSILHYLLTHLNDTETVCQV